MTPSQQSHRLLQTGITLFLFAAVLGLVVPYVPVPRLALSAHLIGLLQGLFLLVLGLLWSRLRLGPGQRLAAFWLLVYQGVAALISNLVAGVWAAGSSVVPMAAGGAYGSPGQEVVINVGLRSAGAALIVGLSLVAWGLRERPHGDATS